MKILGCGILSLTLIYLGLTPICKSIAYLFALLITKAKGELFHCLTQTMFILLCNMFWGVGWLWSYLVNRNTIIQHESLNIIVDSTFEFDKIKEEKRSDIVFNSLLFFIISVLILTQNVIQSYMAFTFDVSQANKKSNLKYELFVLNIFYLSVFSYFILHYSLYRHQVVSLVIILIGMLLILFPNIVYENDLELRLPLLFLEYLLSSLRYVLEKYLMETKFMSAYQVLFFEGLLSSILCIIFGFILEGIPSWKIMFGSSTIIFSELGYVISVEPLKVFLEFVFTLIYYLCAMLVKYYYTPMHCSVTTLLTSLIMWLYVIYKGKLLNDNYAQVAIGYVIIIFGLLLYIEIIIFYGWGLHVNTKKEIESRGTHQENCETEIKSANRSDYMMILEEDSNNKENE